MGIVIGVILGVLIITGALAWGLRHPSPRKRRSDYRHNFDGADVYSAWRSDHSSDKGGGAADGGSF